MHTHLVHAGGLRKGKAPVVQVDGVGAGHVANAAALPLTRRKGILQRPGALCQELGGARARLDLQVPA